MLVFKNKRIAEPFLLNLKMQKHTKGKDTNQLKNHQNVVNKFLPVSLTPKGDMLIKIKVHPNAQQNNLVLRDGLLSLQLTALPVDGQANKHAIKYVAKALNLKPYQVLLVAGNKSREKTFQIVEHSPPLTYDQLRQKISAAVDLPL
ncbi:hypothetical protein DSO57_1010614 [Entomophthora muscae]|uniref:Uncharacterized protein n=1 Tax=Entomophthora muscae TaxID=34485 RepID=A0ACC2RL51_9FUNG|nr:hypothetical protein DSO57_1010614 [Entomophthora muscae]